MKKQSLFLISSLFFSHTVIQGQPHPDTYANWSGDLTDAQLRQKIEDNFEKVIDCKNQSDPGWDRDGNQTNDAFCKCWSYNIVNTAVPCGYTNTYMTQTVYEESLKRLEADRKQSNARQNNSIQIDQTIQIAKAVCIQSAVHVDTTTACNMDTNGAGERFKLLMNEAQKKLHIDTSPERDVAVFPMYTRLFGNWTQDIGTKVFYTHGCLPILKNEAYCKAVVNDLEFKQKLWSAMILDPRDPLKNPVNNQSVNMGFCIPTDAQPPCSDPALLHP